MTGIIKPPNPVPAEPPPPPEPPPRPNRAPMRLERVMVLACCTAIAGCCLGTAAVVAHAAFTVTALEKWRIAHFAADDAEYHARAGQHDAAMRVTAARDGQITAIPTDVANQVDRGLAELDGRLRALDRRVDQALRALEAAPRR